MIASVTSVKAPPVEEVTQADTHQNYRALGVELIGTFFLVFTVGAAVSTASPLAPLAIGSVLMAMVYAGGHISGGHYNPAVTMAVLVRGRIRLAVAVEYWIVQIIAGVLAALVVRGVVTPQAGASTFSMGPALVAELLFTFALAYVVLNVATSKDHANNSFYGLAIGFTVLAGAVAVGGISGGVFNPAVYIGGAVAGVFSWSAIWVYYLAELAAGVIAGLVFRVLNPADK